MQNKYMRKKIFLLLAVCLFILSGCEPAAVGEIAAKKAISEHQAMAAPVLVKLDLSSMWQRGLPEENGLSSEALQRLHNELAETKVVAAVIVRHGVIVDEYYKPGYSSSSVFALNSCSKSITSALLGIAVEQGYIEDVNVPIAQYFPQILQSDSAYRQQITIWHLLTHTSGIDCGDTEFWQAWRSSADWVDYALNRPILFRPGSGFNYATANTHLLSAIIQQATGQSLFEFGQENLFRPVGMLSVTCGTDAQGVDDGGNGFCMTIYDMARFGQLFLQNGQWNGRQIIPADWVRESTSLQFDRSSGSADYGYQWWVRTFGAAGYPAYFAQGHGGQYIFVIPDLELVIVFASDNANSSGVYWQMVVDIVNAAN